MSRPISIQSDHNPLHKLQQINWGLVILICTIASIGFAALYSAAGGNFDPWASRQIARFFVGVIAMFIVALIDIKWWFRLTWPAYFGGLFLLVIVEVMGHVGMGAQRWIDLGFMKLQPSEMMKIAVVMALARYFNAATIDDMRRIYFLIIPALIILAPVALVMLQPDLGTALMIVMAGAAMFFMAGASIWLFIGAGAAVTAAIPIASGTTERAAA